MSLKNRLDALRRQAGGGTALRQRVDTGLRSRLERLGGRVARPAGPVKARQTPAELAARLGGRLIDEHVILVDRELPGDRRHGHWQLAGWRAAPAPFIELPERVVYVDTETTGLAGGTGTVAFMVGVAQADERSVRLRQWLITAFAGERRMLAEVGQALAEAEMIVTYNGKAFDLPLLRSRARLLQCEEFAEPEHCDLLHPVRSLFGRVWPDCRLSTVEQLLLGVQRQGDLPGALAPQAWKDYLAGLREHALEKVAAHNAQDLLSLVVLAPALAKAMHDPSAFGADPTAAALAWNRAGQAERALELLRRCERHLDRRGLLMLANALRRAGVWSEAVAIWESLADKGCQQAREHLAKYYEHVRRDWRRALSYARGLDDSAETRHRCQRLSKLLAATQRRLEL